MIYYVIAGTKKDKSVSLSCTYLTSYNMKMGGTGFGLQSGLYDAIKFESKKTALDWFKSAMYTFGNTYNFEIIPFDSKVFGKRKQKYVISSKDKQVEEIYDAYYLITAYDESSEFPECPNYLSIDDNDELKVSSFIPLALKFLEKEEADKYCEMAKNKYPNLDIEVMPLNKKFFGLINTEDILNII